MAKRIGTKHEPQLETQIDLFAWAEELEPERDCVAQTNAERAARRGFLVFATDPSVASDEPGYRQGYAGIATNWRTPRWVA